jgi:tripartite-type tricarboxylate transporter receptor subunit TctC
VKVGSSTPIGFVAPTPAVPLIKEGKLRALAGTGKNRLPTLPDVPTRTEAGYPEIEGDD